jgi:hypothetical protein
MIPFNRIGVLRFTNFRDCYDYYKNSKPQGFSEAALVKLWNSAFVIQLGTISINLCALATDKELFQKQLKSLNLGIYREKQLEVLVDSWIQMHEENLLENGSIEHDYWLEIVKDEHGIT